MVRAILDGRKTQTRRVVTSQPNPYGFVGDRLWVKETWQPIPAERPSGYWSNPKLAGKNYWYRATDDIPTWGGRWRPSIHMPRIASRINLAITAMRIERLQDITPEDIVAEGAWNPAHSVDEDYSQAYEAWQELWDSINEKRGFGWDTNPYVWVVEFEHVQNRGDLP